ncbi:MAG: ATP-binding protein [Chitinispirillia bacterium]|nr:ATP-binding protein [Chitinispirillia bacterium]MCL2268197.1 ATP-binding protein [Chitinispirillia bacterium]
MEQAADPKEPAAEIAKLTEENGRLKSELRTAKREITRNSTTIIALENNFNVKMNMLRALAAESEKHKRFLTHMMRNSVDFLMLLDDKLNVVYCSDLFMQKIGVEYFNDIEGKHVYEVYRMFADGDLFTLITGGIEIALDLRNVFVLDVLASFQGSSEQRCYRTTNTPMLDNGELHGFSVIWCDITDVMNDKNEAERANMSKSRFLATMSHEIRTPLNAIIGITQIQQQKEDLPDDYSVALDLIYDSGNNLLGLINDILDMSKIETGKLELHPINYDVPSLINDTVQLNVIRIGSKHIKFKLDIEENLPSRLYGDELRLKQILNNLLSNAIKYTKEGQVKFSISHRTDGEDVFLRFAVEDTGQGMKPEDKERVFSEYLRFNTADNRMTEGTGLGLSIAKKLIEMMDGKINVESEYGKGSTFTVTVKQKAVNCQPIGAETSERLRAFTYTNDSRKERRKIVREIMPYGKVLVVDDVKTNLFVAIGLLSPYKLQIETAVSGFEAIDKVNEGKTFDIIFMDHMMPEMDGMETTKKLRDQGYTGIIVALTANALVGNDEMFMQNGFDGFISKPINIRQLSTILNTFIRDRHPEEAQKYKYKGNEAAQAETTEQAAEINPKLLKIFKGDAESAIITLRETAASGALKMFITTAHAMKSALANVNENSLSLKAAELEKAGTDGNTGYINANTEIFLDALGALIKKITPPEEAADTGAADIQEDTEYLHEQFKVIKTACENYDDATVYAAIDKLLERAWRPKTSALISELRDMMFLFSDFDGLAERIGAILT